MKETQVTWDLSVIYPDETAWEKDFEKLDAAAEKFFSFKGKLAQSAQTLKEAIEASDDFDRLAEKLYTYAHLLSDENTAISKNRARVDRICTKLSVLSPMETWFDPEIMAVDDEVMKKLLDAPELAFYKRSLLELLREKTHTLSEPEERLLGTLGDVLGTSNDLFSTLNDTDLQFGKVRTSDGKFVELTHANWSSFMENPDRNVRKNAFHKLYRQYRNFRNSFACTLDATVKRHAAMAKIRNFDSPIQAALFSENIPQEIYDNLISCVKKNLPSLQKYFQLRQNVLNIEKLDMYDLYAPMLPECRTACSFEEGSQLIRDALKPMGKEYLSLLENAWQDKWIDAVCRKGKRSGAYSGGCYDTRPYVLMSYNNTLSDVFTLAHELGHSMHSAFSRKHQHFHYADYEIFVAEVASTCNELLLAEFLLKKYEGDKDLTASVCARVADDIRATVFRQTMFAEFEKGIHEDSANGIPLTAEYLSDKYYNLNAEYHSFINADKDIALEWARIPHFYYNFYVYKYATGMAAALKLSRGLLKGDEDARERYLAFLKAGDSKDVLDILKDAGADLSDPAPVNEALQFFRTTVDRLTGLLQ